MSVKIITGDCRDVLATMADGSVNCCVTSPPYFGLRDYGCDGQMGLESTPDEFVAGMVAVFREVRRVLRDDGTLWLNIGDSYAGSWGAQGKRETPGEISRNSVRNHPKRAASTGTIRGNGLKPKDLIGIPWMLAFALRADGWYLRQDIIWSKPNPMPESVTDRCTKAHEYVFLMSKSERYYYDQDAIKEARSQDEDSSTFRGGCYVSGETDNALMGKRKVPGNKSHKHTTAYEAGKDERLRTKAGLTAYAAREQAHDPNDLGKRNKRSVWTVGSHPFKEAHFATFPPALIEPCILAGCPVGGTVLDPFGGAGTTGMVADRLGRNAVLIELNPEYVGIAERRIKGDAGMFADVAA